MYYKIHPGTHNIAQARNLCKQDASFLTLPMPRDEEQNDYYFDLVGGKQKHDMWLGFSDELKEGTWIGEDGEPVTWFKWGPGEPNNAHENYDTAQGEHWVEIDLTGQSTHANLKNWNDIWFSTSLNGGFNCSGRKKRSDAGGDERLDCMHDNIAVCTFVVPPDSDI